MKNLKKLLIVMVIATVAVMGLLLAGCSEKKDVVALKIEGIEPEDFGFCVKKGNTDLLAKLNTFIGLETTQEALKISLDFHTGVSKTQIEYPNLADNTGGELVMVTEAGFEPYEYANTKKGKGVIDNVSGVDVDMMILFAESQNKTLRIIDTTFNSIPSEVNVDNTRIGAAGMTISEEKAEVVDFTVKYTVSVQYIISLKENSYNTMESLIGKKVGVQSATTGDIVVMGEDNFGEGGVFNNTNTTKKGYDKFMAAFKDLLRGRLDAVVIDELPAKSMVKNYLG